MVEDILSITLTQTIAHLCGVCAVLNAISVRFLITSKLAAKLISK